MKFIHDDIEISRGWFQPWTTAPALVGLALLAWSAWLVRAKWPLYAFGIGLFFIGHLLESSVLPLDLMYEHRQYLPSIGLLLASASVCMPLCTRRWVVIAVLVPTLALLSAMTWTRAQTWSSEKNLFQEMVRINQHSPRAMTMVANWYGNRGEIAAARALLMRVESPAARLNALYYDCLADGEVTGAQLMALPEPDILSFYEASGLMYLGRAGLAGDCNFPVEAYLVLLERWLDRSRSGLYIYRGYYLDRAGKHADAVESFEQAYRAGGEKNPIPLVIAAELLIDAGELERAERMLARARSSVRNGIGSRDIEMAAERMRLAHEEPDKLKPFDPFQK
jgi:tetratricopeptide (TPR) repeat protein